MKEIAEKMDMMCLNSRTIKMNMGALFEYNAEKQ